MAEIHPTAATNWQNILLLANTRLLVYVLLQSSWFTHLSFLGFFWIILLLCLLNIALVYRLVGLLLFWTALSHSPLDVLTATSWNTSIFYFLYDLEYIRKVQNISWRWTLCYHSLFKVSCGDFRQIIELFCQCVFTGISLSVINFLHP